MLEEDLKVVPLTFKVAPLMFWITPLDEVTLMLLNSEVLINKFALFKIKASDMLAGTRVNLMFEILRFALFSIKL